MPTRQPLISNENKVRGKKYTKMHNYFGNKHAYKLQLQKFKKGVFIATGLTSKIFFLYFLSV
jgi:hypothetical protein